MMSFYTEREIAPVALEIIGNRPGIHTSELIDAVRQQMRPDGEDCEILRLAYKSRCSFRACDFIISQLSQ